MAYEETALIIEIEIEELNNLEKFGQFIDLTTFYHLRRCRHNFGNNCTFIDKITNVYIENFHNEENGINNLQKLCREYFGNFFSMVSLLNCLVVIEWEKVELEEKFNDLLKVWNE